MAVETKSPTTTQPEFNRVEAILELARHGERRVLPNLRRLLAEAPAIAAHFGDVAALAEDAIICSIAGDDLRIREALAIKIGQMRMELAGPNPSPVERLLVDRLAISWLAAYEADLKDALLSSNDSIKVSEFRMKRVDAAHRRMLSAATALAKVRRLTAGIKIEINHTQGGDPDGDRAQLGPARERLREALAESTAMDRGLVEAAS